MLEKESLSIQKGPNGEIDELRFDPKHFNPKALAAIILYQVNAASPNDIIVSGPEKSLFIGRKDFQAFRHLDANQRIKTVCGAVEDMKRAEEVIIERTESARNANKQKEISESEKELFMHRMLKAPNKVLVLKRSRLDMLRY